MSEHGEQLSTQLGRALLSRSWMMSCAESCTGGGVAQEITAIAGSSHWFEAGFVTYTNEMKQRLLGVPQSCFSGPEAPGAVSEETALAMAEGAMRTAETHCSVSTTGIAGPNGGSAEKPVGTVWIGWAWQDDEGQVQSRARRFHFPGDRTAVRRHSIVAALEGMLEIVNTVPVADENTNTG